jgi:hypothetical protein
MGDEELEGEPALRQEMDELREQVAFNRADIDELQARADEANHRADASETRADVSDAHADENRRRIDQLEARADIDQKLITELQAEGILSREHAAHLEQALRTSRMIGAAVGIVMANRRLNDVDAFAILVSASQNGNRKLRLVAEEVVQTGDVSQLPTA